MKVCMSAPRIGIINPEVSSMTKKPDKRTNKEENCFDSLGSYTGRGTDPFEKPVQDADDL